MVNGSIGGSGEVDAYKFTLPDRSPIWFDSLTSNGRAVKSLSAETAPLSTTGSRPRLRSPAAWDGTADSTFVWQRTANAPSVARSPLESDAPIPLHPAEKEIADARIRDTIVTKADGGRRQEAIQDILDDLICMPCSWYEYKRKREVSAKPVGYLKKETRT